MSILIVVNDAPYGTEKAFNALRTAVALRKQTPELKLGIFLLADSVGCGIPGQKTPAGYYNIERMLKSLISKGVEVKACGLCLEARGLRDLYLIEGVQRSNMIEFAKWIKDFDKILTF